jgi:GTPase SAR1 family protein
MQVSVDDARAAGALDGCGRGRESRPALRIENDRTLQGADPCADRRAASARVASMRRNDERAGERGPMIGSRSGRAALTDSTRAVLLAAIRMYGHEPRTRGWLDGHLERLDDPLRIAIAGKVKAGKSTLLNALVGEQVAPTDAGECTQIVTWYRDGLSPAIVVYPSGGGAPAPLPVHRRDGALVIDLQGHSVEDLDRVVVDWPSQSLRAATLIDTPGTASLSVQTSHRTVRFLHPEEDTATEADAVIYLMRQLHASDYEFLEAFRDQGVASAASINTVGVISRADEIGGGRVDAMESAQAVAARYRVEPALRGLCQNVVAVAGLVAQTARTLRQTEFIALRELARVSSAELGRALLAADRFVADGPETASVAAVQSDVRRALLLRFGMFGLRLSTTLLQQGVNSPAALATELVDRSGLTDLKDILHNQFTERRDVLKARSALLALDSFLRADPRPGSAELAGDVERIFAGAHEFTELRLLSALRSGAIALPGAVVLDAERLLGETGAAVRTRLALPPDADSPVVREAALEALSRWHDLAENPMTARSAADACRVLVRTCEGMLVASAG